MAAQQLLSNRELFSSHFLSLLVKRNPGLRTPIEQWLKRAKEPGATSQQTVQGLLSVGPAHVLQAAQEEFIKIKASLEKPSAANNNNSTGEKTAAMQPTQGGNMPLNLQNLQNLQNLTPQQQQALLANIRGQANPAAAGWNQQPARTVSPAPGQTPAAVAAANQAALQHSALIQQLIIQQQQQQVRQAQLVQHAAQQARARQGPAAGPGRTGSGTTLAGIGSAGNLAALGTGALQVNPAAAAAALQRPGSAGMSASLAAAAAAAAAAGRPLAGAGGAVFNRGVGLNPAAVGAGAGGVLDHAVKAQVQATLKQLKAGEAPKVEPPDGHEWVQCVGKDGKLGWFAVLKAKAQLMRAAAAGVKRKAEEGPAGQPAAKQGGAAGVKKKDVDDDLVAGGGPVNMLLMDDDAVEAEEAAARAAVVVEAGNVQEEYLLNPNTTMTLVARAAKEGGVKAVSDAVYPFLSLAAEAYLAQLLNSMVKVRLQREDLGKGYFGVVPADKSQGDLRAKLYRMRQEEKGKATERANAERDELAKLGTSRKKMGEDEKKAAQAARLQREMEHKKASVGSTLQMLGISHRGFTTFGKSASRTGTAKPGLTKQELLEAKAAAAAADSSSSAAPGAATPAAAAASTPAAAAAAAAAGGQEAASIKQEPSAGTQPPGTAAATAAGSGQQGNASQAAAAAGPPPLKPLTLQHQLLGASDLQSSVTPFVAGGVPARKVRDGDEAARELTLTDLVAVMERHPLYCRSTELYKLQTLAALQADGQK